MIVNDLFEVSLGDYQKKATMQRAMAQMGAAFAPDQATREKEMAKAKKREQGLARAKVRSDRTRAAADAKSRADALAADRANLDQMKSQLASLEAQFDPNFEYSDDHSFWSRQKSIQQSIAGLKQRIARAEEAPMNEAELDPSVNYNVPAYQRKAKGQLGRLAQPAQAAGSENPVSYFIDNPETKAKYLPSQLKAPAAPSVPASMAAPSSPALAAPASPVAKRTGGKVAGQLSQTPNAIRKRQARAAASAAPASTGANVFGAMAQQLTPTSTGGKITPTTRGVRHTAAATNPNQTTPAAAPVAAAPAPVAKQVKPAPTVPATPEPITIGGQKIQPTDPAYAKIMKTAPTAAKPALSSEILKMLDKVKSKQDLAKIKTYVDSKLKPAGQLSESQRQYRNIIMEEITRIGAIKRRENLRNLAK